MVKKIIIPADAGIKPPEGSNVLHTYSNGDQLVAIQQEAQSETEMSDTILSGLQINVSPINDGPSLENKSANDLVMAYITLIGPTDPDWLQTLQTKNINILNYQPHNSYLCQGQVKDFMEAKLEPFVEDIVIMDERFKGNTPVGESGMETVWIIYTPHQEELAEILDKLNHIDGVILDKTQQAEQVEHYWRIKADVNAQGQSTLLSVSQVLGLEPYIRASPEDEVANLIIAGEYTPSGIPRGQYLKWLADKRLSGRGVTIGIVDTGVDVNHEAFRGRITDLAGGKKNWHATFVAGHAAGDYRSEKDAQGFIYGIGVAPKAELLSIDSSNVVSNPVSIGQQTVNNAGPSGNKGYVQNNSWGAGTNNPMNYTSLEAAYDRMVRNADPNKTSGSPLVVCFSAGNSGASGLTRPKSAKNIIVTGNSENYRPNVGNNYSDNINDVYQNPSWQPSSHGNCGDGRIRPHIVAPGEWTAAANYGMTAGHVEYISPKLTWGGGTSGASPKTAGACALLIEWWKKQTGESPSPAMLRALLVNGAEPMSNAISRPPVPSKVQGWGRINLANILDEDVHRVVLDQKILLYRRGEQWNRRFVVSDPTRPVKVTLTWTDPPGGVNTGNSLDNPAIVNRLNLRIDSNGNSYQGNNFVQGWSIAGPHADPRLKGIDNTQNVFIQAGEVDFYFNVCVEALNIAANCFDFRSWNPVQDFALIVHNAHPDYNFTPADLFIVIDEHNQTSETSGTETGSSNDSIDWAESSPRAESTAQGLTKTNASESSVNGNGQGLAPENTGLVEEAANAGVTRGLAMMGPQTPDHHLGVLGKQESETGFQIRNWVNPIHMAIKKLLDEWKDLAVDRVKKGVIVVHKHSHINDLLLSGLSRLAFQGELILVSDHPPILQEIAHRLQLKQRVKLLTPGSVQSLEDCVRDAMAMASNAIPLVVAPERNAGGQPISNFQLIPGDKKFSLRIGFNEEQLKPLILQLPNAAQEKVNLLDEGQIQGKGFQLVQESNAITLSGQLAEDQQDQWAGTWKIAHSEDCKVDAWVWGNFPVSLSIRAQQEATQVDQNNETDGLLLTAISRSAEMSLESLRLTIKQIEASQGQKGSAESGEMRLVRAQVRTPFEETLQAESGSVSEAPKVKTLSEWIAQTFPAEETQALDIRVEVRGQLNQYPFSRVLFLNWIHLASPTARKKKELEVPKRFGAKVSEIHYQNGQLKGLKLDTPFGMQDFGIADKALEGTIRTLTQRFERFEFEVKENEITGITLVLA